MGLLINCNICCSNMLKYVITLLIITLAYLIYEFWIKPLRTIKSYAKKLRNMGYNVLEVAFNPFKNEMVQTIRQGRNLYGDDLRLYKVDRRNYDVIVSNSFNKPRLQFHHPDFIKDFYVIDNNVNFAKTKSVVEVLAKIAGHGVTFSEGQVWRRKRNILNKVFNFDFLKSLTNNIAHICDETIREFQKRETKNEKQNSVRYKILEFTTAAFSRVMMQSFFGGYKQEYINGVPASHFLKELISDLTGHSFSPFNFFLGSKLNCLGFTKTQRDINARIEAYKNWGHSFVRRRIIQINQSLEKNQKTQNPGILQALVKAKRTEGGNNKETMFSEEEIFQQFTTFYLGGTDTTSNFTQMMIYEIGRHPEIQEKLRKQIQTYFGGNDFSYENIKNLSYIQMFQKQITRTYGPLNNLFSRYAVRDCYLNGLPVKAGTGISISHIGNHHSQKYFKDPFELRPERWESESKQIPSFAVGGFGAGPRSCIGKHLALLESKIMITKFLKRYKKIILPKNNFKMMIKLTYVPEDLEVKMIINDQK